MKRIIATVAFVGLCQIVAFGQNKYEMVVEKTDGSETVFNVEEVVRTYFRQRSGGEEVYTSCPDANHPHMIDLGLPSGTLWACCNVGASAPEQYGNYYAWGETQPKSVYNWDTYQYGYYNYDEDYSHLVNIGSDIGGTSYDVATVNWGAPWRIPSLTQIQELLDNCTSTWISLNGEDARDGRKFVGPNGGTIFLPTAGHRWFSNLTDMGMRGLYWSSTLYYQNYVYWLELGGFMRLDGERRFGKSVRPVCKN